MKMGIIGECMIELFDQGNGQCKRSFGGDTQSLYGIAELADKLPEVNKTFDVVNDNYENNDDEYILLSLIKQYIDRQSKSSEKSAQIHWC